MAGVPTAPGPWKITSYTNVRVAGKANANSTGGATILEWQLAWGTNTTNATHTGTLNADGSGFVAGLVPGVTYYFWSRQRNAYGWSDLSQMTQVRMRDVPDAPKTPISMNRTQTSVTILLAPNWNGDSPITNYELGYGLSPNQAQFSIMHGVQASFPLLNLVAGRTYYFWGRCWNTYGAGALSPRLAVTLIAGARVNVGGVWKRAVPYVRVNGVWEMHRAWVKQNGVWKQLSD